MLHSEDMTQSQITSLWEEELTQAKSGIYGNQHKIYYDYVIALWFQVLEIIYIFHLQILKIKMNEKYYKV